MSCTYKQTKGKNKGELCGKTAKYTYENNQYCKFHYKRVQKKGGENPMFTQTNINKQDNEQENKQEKQNKQHEQSIEDIIDNYNENKQKNYEDVYDDYMNEHNNLENEEDYEEVAQDITRTMYSEKFIKDSLFNINLIAMNGVETCSKLQDKYANLEGLTNDVLDDEEMYKEVLYNIYLENPAEIDKYLSPMVQYMLLVTKNVGTRFAVNQKKKVSGSQ